MKLIGVLLILTGLASIGIGSLMIGDLGLGSMIGGVIGILAGIAVFRIPGTIKKIITAEQTAQ